jgi:hypothetical protein
MLGCSGPQTMEITELFDCKGLKETTTPVLLTELIA